jgi:dihydrofolate reductase
MKIAIIVAAAENNVIGDQNKLIWHLPNDLKRFKALTMGHPIIMGRKTFESIGKPLPGRHSIIITRQKNYVVAGCTVVNSLEGAIKASGDVDVAYIIGGADIYRQAMNLTDIIYLTRVHTTSAGDVHFPEIIPAEWATVEEETCAADEKHKFSYSFITLKKII